MNWILLFCIFIIALLYSSVGHGGATGYLAVMSLWGVQPDRMASTALILNCITAGISFLSYKKEGEFSFSLIMPFLITSIPAAFIGAMVNLNEAQYAWILAIVLIATSLKLWFVQTKDHQAEQIYKKPGLPIAIFVGSCLGFLSGAIGIGGGVFLSPVIILLGWASPKTTAGCAALFIVLNSITGLIARFFAGKVVIEDIFPFLLCALIGAILGSRYGAEYSSPNTLRKLVSFVLILASIKMFIAN